MICHARSGQDGKTLDSGFRAKGERVKRHRRVGCLTTGSGVCGVWGGQYAPTPYGLTYLLQLGASAGFGHERNITCARDEGGVIGSATLEPTVLSSAGEDSAGTACRSALFHV